MVKSTVIGNPDKIIEIFFPNRVDNPPNEEDQKKENTTKKPLPEGKGKLPFRKGPLNKS